MVTTLHKRDNEFTIDRIDDFEKFGFIADYYPPNTDGNYAVVVLGGSEGGKPTYLAEKIVSLGYAVLSLAYFNFNKFLPSELEMIPLEYFENAKKWILSKNEIRKDGLILAGWSKGAELALILSSRDQIYKGVVAIGPSSAVWPGIIKNWHRKPNSSWSINKKPLPFVSFVIQNEAPKKLVDLYMRSLQVLEDSNKETIDFDKIQNPVLLLSGSLDVIWPSEMMAGYICTKLNKLNHINRPLCTHFNYKNAGHLLDERFDLGGTKEANHKANIDSTKKIKEFLKSINQI
ncbi:hypothetical protein AWE51_18850 [Aquimarina aggregata]|uniref:BAAT/Acyl-CoA thioester hydrolase C-terminal domain-containing protein n=1 Tax=Aquimarina aggregata TaxID=1642818 RepID=A0A162WHK6_9FLAO|nr:acyl-CoA thioester hydrolase/BAAT C-terminal domain-containing protein [Aquimarina aggregata]KZS38106.1 hypothetical protein AWE51_18850 [Aquimarina aggregata]